MAQSAFTAGVELVLFGGILTGSFAVPMKHIRAWKWEHIWFVYSLSAMIVIPWAMAWATVPGLWQVYRSQPAVEVLLMGGLGLGWGVGSLFYGLAVDYVGIALSFALILGLTAAAGSLFPLLLQHRDRIFTAAGEQVLAGVALTLVGIGLCALAGYWREGRHPTAGEAPDRGADLAAAVTPAAGGDAAVAVAAPGRTAAQSRYLTGALICIASGLLSPMLNDAFAAGGGLRKAAVAAGALPTNAVNPIWALVLTGGFLVNGGYCLGRMRQRRSLGALATPGWVRHWLLAGLMGLLWVGGILSYGMGASRMGTLAAEMGWPMLMSTSIIAATVWGIAGGEWRSSSGRAWGTMLSGILVLTVAMFVIGRA